MHRFIYNLSEVFTVASMAGASFSACCLDGPHWIRAAVMCVIFFILTCFFAVVHEIVEEVRK